MKVVQVNVSMQPEDAETLDRLVRESGYDNRSAFVRWLIRNELARRVSQPNPCITVEQAQNRTEG